MAWQHESGRCDAASWQPGEHPAAAAHAAPAPTATASPARAQADGWIKQIEKQLEVTQAGAGVKLALQVDENPPPPPAGLASPEKAAAAVALAAAGTAAAAAAASRGAKSEPLPKVGAGASLKGALPARAEQQSPRGGKEGPALGPVPSAYRMLPVVPEDGPGSGGLVARGSGSRRGSPSRPLKAALSGAPRAGYLVERDMLFASLPRHVRVRLISDNFHGMMAATLDSVRGAQAELVKLADEAGRDYESLLRCAGREGWGGGGAAAAAAAAAVAAATCLPACMHACMPRLQEGGC